MNISNKNFIKKIRSITNQIPIPSLVDRHDYRKSIFVAGSGRSGTTWLQEIINYHNEYRVMFEPFYPQKVNIVSDWHPFQYLRTEDTEQRFLRPAEAILCGNVKNFWVDKYNKRLFSQRRVIKDIRANLFLHWIKDNFPEIPIILIMRHPCAVANSKSQGNWENNLDHYLSQEDLMEDYLEKRYLKIVISKILEIKSSLKKFIKIPN